jgi:long-chain-fatty-acid--[acyl-carrier-protein] ligase
MIYFYIVEFLNLLTSIFFRLYHYVEFPLRYKVQVIGKDPIRQMHKTDPKGGCLFLSNHPSHLDAQMITFTLWKMGHRLTVWTMDFVFKNFYIRLAAKNSNTVKLIKVPNISEERHAKNRLKLRKLIRRTIEGLQEGENILFFPAGSQKHGAREDLDGKSAVHRILQQYPNANIIMVRILGMWGSRFSKAVSKMERSDLHTKSWISFLLRIVKIIFLNLIIFIPKRLVRIEFVPAGPDFPRNGTRQEINSYLEAFYNKGFESAGEPLQKVPDYFWNTQYPSYEYHLKKYEYDLEKVPLKIQEGVKTLISQKTQIPTERIEEWMLLDRDLCLDSLEITEILIELEKGYGVTKQVPKRVGTVGHLMALAAGLPVQCRQVAGQFHDIKEQRAPMVRAWQACSSAMASFFALFSDR